MSYLISFIWKDYGEKTQFSLSKDSLLSIRLCMFSADFSIVLLYSLWKADSATKETWSFMKHVLLCLKKKKKKRTLCIPTELGWATHATQDKNQDLSWVDFCLPFLLIRSLIPQVSSWLHRPLLGPNITSLYRILQRVRKTFFPKVSVLSSSLPAFCVLSSFFGRPGQERIHVSDFVIIFLVSELCWFSKAKIWKWILILSSYF